MTDVWFSAMLRFAILVEGEGAIEFARSLIVFRAEDFPDAKERAISLGRSMETTHTGGLGEEVKWRLQRVETLDLLGDQIMDGREVYAESLDLPDGPLIPFDAQFDPRASQPGQSGV